MVFDWFFGVCFVCDYVVGVVVYYWYDGLEFGVVVVGMVVWLVIWLVYFWCGCDFYVGVYFDCGCVGV